MHTSQPHPRLPVWLALPWLALPVPTLPLALPLALLPALLLLAGCRSSNPDAAVADLVRRGDYARAVRRARENAEDHPRDSSAQETFLRARVAYLLDQARDTLFAGDPDHALEILHVARSLDPGNPTVATWIEKVHKQRAEEWLDMANDRMSSRELEEARQAYENALRHDPENRQARLGLSRVLLTMNYREGQSRSYFTKGLQTFRDYLLPRADNNFEKSIKFDEDNERAQERKEEVEEALVEERLTVARQFEEDGFIFAARNEYRLALLLEPDDPEALEGLNRMDREVRANRALGDSDMQFRRGEFEEAEEALGKAEALTESQTDHVGRMRGQIEDARLGEMYEKAVQLERDYMYEEAIEAYDELLSQVESYEDAAARKAALEDFVARADELYEGVLGAENDLEELQYLREIDVFWPEYRDVPERIGEFVERANRLSEQARGAEDPRRAHELLSEIAAFWPGYPGLRERLRQLEAEIGS